MDMALLLFVYLGSNDWYVIGAHTIQSFEKSDRLETLDVVDCNHIFVFGSSQEV